MKIIQLLSHDGEIIGLGDDGQMYVRELAPINGRSERYCWLLLKTRAPRKKRTKSDTPQAEHFIDVDGDKWARGRNRNEVVLMTTNETWYRVDLTCPSFSSEGAPSR